MSFERHRVNRSAICGVAQCPSWSWRWAMLPLSHSLGVAWATCSVTMGLRVVALVTPRGEAFSVSDEPPHLSLVTPAGGYPE